MTTSVLSKRLKDRKKKKEVQEEESDESRHWGLGTGTGWTVYGQLTLVDHVIIPLNVLRKTMLP